MESDRNHKLLKFRCVLTIIINNQVNRKSQVSRKKTHLVDKFWEKRELERQRAELVKLQETVERLQIQQLERRQQEVEEEEQRQEVEEEEDNAEDYGW